MKNLKSLLGINLICLCILSGKCFTQAQTSVNTNIAESIDIEKLKQVIESRTAQYSKYLLKGDSVSIAAMYAEDGTMGCSKGDEILSSVGKWIHNYLKNDSQYVSFSTNTLNADGELLIETGTAEGRNEKGELKYTFRYLVVWKKENGTWKLYRDFSL